MQRHAVHGRGHAVLAHAVMHVVAGEVAGLDDGVQLGERAVRAGEIGGAADQPGNDRHELLQHLLRGLARGELGGLAAEIGFERLHRGYDLAAHLGVDRIGRACARLAASRRFAAFCQRS